MGFLRRPAGAPPHVAVLVALLALTVTIGALLANEAREAMRSHRVTAERVLRDYASFAAAEFLAGAKEDLHGSLTDALSPVTAGKLSSGYEALPAPQELAAAAGTALRCERPADDSSRLYFRVDFRDGSLATWGAPASRELRRWLADTVATHARDEYRADSHYAVLFGRPEGANGVARALVYGVKYAQFGAPVAAYGIMTCPSAFGVPLFRDVMRRHALLPTAVTRGASDDSLLSVTVFDASGHELFRSAPERTPSAYTGEVPLDEFGGLRVRVALRPGAAERLAVGAPASTHLPVLFGLLVLTAALAAVAALQLRRAHELARLRADFTSSVSHELRTPLAQILLFGETLALGRARGDVERRVAAETIVQEARRLMHMVENVLLFARSERGPHDIDARPIELAPLLGELVAGFAPVADAAGVSVVTRFAPAVVAVADPSAVRQIVLNLLDNAVKYGPSAQTVIVTLDRDAEMAHVSVEDEGTGVAASDRERIWLPFVRLTRDRRAAGYRPGSGLGLAVVRDLARLQGGEARVEDGERGGARFVVELPLAPNVVPPDGESSLVRRSSASSVAPLRRRKTSEPA